MGLPIGKALRFVFGETLAEVADSDPRLVVLDGDVAMSTGTEIFQIAHPERFLQTGIAEQNMLGIAAGLATVGFIPVVSTFSCFAVGRAYDSIRVLIAQPGLNVKITGGYAGLHTGMAGKTHQMFNDIALMRTLPNVTLLAPADEIETRQAVKAMVAQPGAFYMQLTREPSPIVFDAGYQFELGRAVYLRDGGDVALVSTGVETARVLEAAQILAERGLQATVLHVPTVKPLDEEALAAAARRTGVVVVIEEQSVLGGLGGAVAESLATHQPVTVHRLGIQDVFGESGPNDALLDRYRLSPAPLADDISSLLKGTPPAAGRTGSPAEFELAH